MAANGDDAMGAIREQLQEQELALLEIEVALQHEEDAEVLQVLSSVLVLQDYRNDGYQDCLTESHV